MSLRPRTQQEQLPSQPGTIVLVLAVGGQTVMLS
jgi:hypothetical protein